MSSLYPHLNPIRKTLCFDIENVLDDLDEAKYSKPVSFLDAKFYLLTKIDRPICDDLKRSDNSNELEESVPCLQVALQYINEFRHFSRFDGFCHFRILNHNMSKSVTSRQIRFNEYYENFVFFISLSKINDGFMNNNSVKIECDIELNLNYYFYSLSLSKSRPNYGDVKSMFRKLDYQPTKGSIKMEKNLSELSEEFIYSNTFDVDRVPCKIGFLKENEFLKVWLFLNSEDESEWWRVLASSELLILNKMEPYKPIRLIGFKRQFDSHKNMCELFGSIPWSDLTSCSKNGKISIRIIIGILEKYGFDKETGKGIEKPMKKMTDAVISVEDRKFHVSRMILSHQSEWFRDLFSENPEKTEFSFTSFRGSCFDTFLDLVYFNGSYRIVCNEDTVKEILEMLDELKAYDCMKRYDLWLLDTPFMNDMKILKLIDQYQLPKMKEKYIRKFQDSEERRKLISDPEFSELSEQFRKELDMKEVPNAEDDDDEIFYEYSKQTEIDDEIPMGKLQISFKEFSDPNDLILLEFEDNKTFYSSKQILGNESEYFMKRLFGPDAKDDDDRITFDDISSAHFNILLNHIYHKRKVITERNVDVLISLAHLFSIRYLLWKCEEFLLKTETISLEKIEEYAKKYNLEYLSSACINFKTKS